jgi:hypothetical protein
MRWVSVSKLFLVEELAVTPINGKKKKGGDSSPQIVNIKLNPCEQFSHKENFLQNLLVPLLQYR